MNRKTLEREAERLYTENTRVAPLWDQLGDVTKSVWREKAEAFLLGLKRWYSINPYTDVAPVLGLRIIPRSNLIMNAKIAKKLAEQFAEMGVLMDAISGTFRAASDSGEDTAGNGGAGTKVRPGTKTAPAKSAARGKAKADAEDDVTEDDVREALQGLAESKGKGALVAALGSVGAGALKDVDESQYQELIDNVTSILESGEEYDDDGEVIEAPAKGKKAPAKKAAPAAKTTRAKKATRESATEKFSELAAEDEDAAKALLKELGVKRFGLLDDDSDWTEITEQIAEAFEGEGGLV